MTRDLRIDLTSKKLELIEKQKYSGNRIGAEIELSSYQEPYYEVTSKFFLSDLKNYRERTANRNLFDICFHLVCLTYLYSPLSFI